jgi:alkylation response protein AidB-like acyl-CoA dehydrogenase
MDAIFQQSYMWAPGLRIAGGTDEILKNIIAERVLGLPADVRVDKDVAFKDLPSGR